MNYGSPAPINPLLSEGLEIYQAAEINYFEATQFCLDRPTASHRIRQRDDGKLLQAAARDYLQTMVLSSSTETPVAVTAEQTSGFIFEAGVERRFQLITFVPDIAFPFPLGKQPEMQTWFCGVLTSSRTSAEQVNSVFARYMIDFQIDNTAIRNVIDSRVQRNRQRRAFAAKRVLSSISGALSA